MKSTVLKWYMFALLFVSEFTMFAQGSTSEDQDTDPLEANDGPINSKIFVLVIMAVVFAAFYFKKSKSAISSN